MWKRKVRKQKTLTYLDPIYYQWCPDMDIDAVDVSVLDKDESIRLQLRVSIDERGDGYVTFYNDDDPVTFRMDRFVKFLESAKGRIVHIDEDAPPPGE